MIINWRYNNHGDERENIKKLIYEKQYKTIDVGASARYWSYPECRFILDSMNVVEKDIHHFVVNIENSNEWSQIFDYVEKNGKFDFSICSHTLEDVFNPTELIKNLEKISHRGYIAIPSKFNEFKKLYNNQYRGDAHHKQLFDMVDNVLTIFPKYSWIEVDKRSDNFVDSNFGNELTLFWENEIPFRIFGNGKPFIGDDTLINEYYKELQKNI